MFDLTNWLLPSDRYDALRARIIPSSLTILSWCLTWLLVHAVHASETDGSSLSVPVTA